MSSVSNRIIGAFAGGILLLTGSLAAASVTAWGQSVAACGEEAPIFLRQDYITGSGSRSIASGDFNADGAVDLAVATNDDIDILLGDGEGGFGESNSFVAGLFPRSVTVGGRQQFSRKARGYAVAMTCSLRRLFGIPHFDGPVWPGSIQYGVGRHDHPRFIEWSAE